MVGSPNRTNYRSTQGATPVLPRTASAAGGASAVAADTQSSSSSQAGASAHLLNQAGGAQAAALREQMAQLQLTPLSEQAMLLSPSEVKKPKGFFAGAASRVKGAVGSAAGEVARVVENLKNPADDLAPTSLNDLSSWLTPANAYPLAKAWGEIQPKEPKTEGLLMVLQRLNNLQSTPAGQAAKQALRQGGIEHMLAAITQDPNLRQTCLQLCEPLMAHEKSVSSHQALLCYAQMQQACQLKQAQTNAHQARLDVEASLETGNPADQRFAQNHYRQSLQSLTKLGVQAFRTHRLDTDVQREMSSWPNTTQKKIDNARWQLRVSLAEKEGVRSLIDLPSNYLSQELSEEVSADFPKKISAHFHADAVMATDEEVQLHLLNQWPALQEHLPGPACRALFPGADSQQMVGELLRAQDLQGDRREFSNTSASELKATNAHLRRNNDILVNTSAIFSVKKTVPMTLSQEVGEWFHADQRRDLMARYFEKTSPQTADLSTLLFHLRRCSLAHEPQFRQQVQQMLERAIEPGVLPQVLEAVAGLDAIRQAFTNVCAYQHQDEDLRLSAQHWQPSEGACLQAFHQVSLVLSAAEVQAGKYADTPASLMTELVRQFRHAELSKQVEKMQTAQQPSKHAHLCSRARTFSELDQYVQNGIQQYKGDARSNLFKTEVQLNEALDLRLPLCPTGATPTLSPEFTALRDQVLENTHADAFLEFASQWPPLIAALKQQHPQAFERPTQGQGSQKRWDAFAASLLIDRMMLEPGGR